MFCVHVTAARARAFAFVRHPIFPLPTQTHAHTHIIVPVYVPTVCRRRSVLCAEPLFDDGVYIFFFFLDLSFYVLCIHRAKVSEN